MYIYTFLEVLIYSSQAYELKQSWRWNVNIQKKILLRFCGKSNVYIHNPLSQEERQILSENIEWYNLKINTDEMYITR